MSDLEAETQQPAAKADLKNSSGELSGRVSSVAEIHSSGLKPESALKQAPEPSSSGGGTKSDPQSLKMTQSPAVTQPNLSPTAPLSEPTVPVAAIPQLAVKDSDLRLRKHADYQRAYKATRKQFSSSMSWFLAVRSQIPDSRFLNSSAISPCPRVGLTVGKVLGKAHERNLIKRRMRQAVRHAIHELPEGVDLILHPKRSVMTMDFGKLEAEVLRIFRQAAAQTREMAVKAAQAKPVLGPEAVQNSGQKRAVKQAPSQSPSETMPPS
jgi:ribonuclease P protein component